MKILGLVGLGAAGLLLFFLLMNDHDDVKADLVPEETPASEESLTYELPAYGVVQASDTVTVVAKQAGTVSSVSVTEGMEVVQGEIMSTAINPVLEATLGATVLASRLRALGTESNDLSQNLAQHNAVSLWRESQATDMTADRAASNRLNESTENLRSALLSALITVPPAFAFMQENRSLFSRESVDLADKALKNLYGSAPQHLTPQSYMVGGKGSDLETSLRVATSSEEIRNVSEAMREVVAVIEAAYTASERDFYSDIEMSDERFAAYNEYRLGVRTLANDLRSAEAALSTTMDTATLGDTARTESIYRADVTASTTALLANLSRESVGLSQALIGAEAGVISAQIELGVARAPFGGIVSEVLVEQGQYVVSGTPLFTLVGEGAREVEVSIPVTLLPLVGIGTPYTLNGVVIGAVDRVVPVTTGGGALAVITLNQPLVVGTTITGALSVSVVPSDSQTIRRIKRNELRFISVGPVVESTDGEITPVTILADNGQELLITAEAPIPATLRKYVGTLVTP